MSPVGGVGINFSIENLQKVQKRREWPARMTQRLQILAQDRIITRVLDSTQVLEPPLLFRLLTRFARLRRLPGRLIAWVSGRSAPAPAEDIRLSDVAPQPRNRVASALFRCNSSPEKRCVTVRVQTFS